jgi:hypothetical protein
VVPFTGSVQQNIITSKIDTTNPLFISQFSPHSKEKDSGTAEQEREKRVRKWKKKGFGGYGYALVSISVMTADCRDRRLSPASTSFFLVVGISFYFSKEFSARRFAALLFGCPLLALIVPQATPPTLARLRGYFRSVPPPPISPPFPPHFPPISPPFPPHFPPIPAPALARLRGYFR